MSYTIFADAAPATPAAPASQAGTTQPANGQAPQPGIMDGLGGMVPFILIIVVMFYLMYRSQKKEQKKRQELLDSVKKDDSIVTIGGICGVVTEIHDDRFKIRVAANTEIEVTKNAIAGVNKPETEVVKK